MVAPRSEAETRLILDPLPLRTRKGIPHLLRYAGNTQRLTVTFREVRPDDGFKIKEKEIKERTRKQHNRDYNDEWDGRWP